MISRLVADALARPLPALTRRDVRLPCLPGKAVAVIGPRRAGKTTFLWQVLKDRLAAGTPREHLLLLGLEDDRLPSPTVEDLDLALETFFRLHPEARESGRPTICLDEVQLVPGWERFVRRVLDTENAEVLVSGSSARMLSREIATSMRGRAATALVLPFSFREFLRHRGREPAGAPCTWSSAERSRIHHELGDYLSVGGYPEAQGASVDDRFELLRSYVDVAVFRDVVERHEVSHTTALRWMTRRLLGNAAGRFSVSRMHRDLGSQGVAVGKDTLHELLGHLVDAFLIRTVEIESGSVKRKTVNPRVCYPIDPGLIPVFDRSGRANAGHALETSVLLELERRRCEVTYVKSREGWEVDFLARGPTNDETLVQVCHSVSNEATQGRELRALVSAARAYPRARRQLVTTTPDAIDEPPDGVEVHDAAEWLLGSPARGEFA